MAVSDSAKVDLLYKKLFGVAKTDLPANKSPSNESIASPALLRGDNVWQQAASIPGTAAATAGIVQAYTGASAVQCTADTTSTPISSVYPSWKTNLTDWIPSEFGSTYFVQVWVDSSGVANPTSTGTQIFDSGIAGVGEWNFDYQSGVLNFIGGTIPASLTVSKVIYIVGYRYIGTKGVANFTGGLTIGNITINGNTITGNTGVTFGGNITGNVTGNVTGTILTPTQSLITTIGTLGNLSVTSNISAGNLLVNGFFWGNGVPVVFSNYGNSNVSLLLSNFGSNTISTTGNITAGNVSAAQFTGNTVGSLFGNATGTTATYTNLSGTLTTAAQTNITSVGTLVSLGVTGNITAGNVSAAQFTGNLVGNATGTTATYTNLSGTLTTSSQTNITSVGTLGSLSVSGNIVSGNVNSTFHGNVYSDYISANVGNVVTVTGTGSLKLPTGTTSNRPVGQAGYIRYNTDNSTFEYFDGYAWISIVNGITDQQITPDGTSSTYTLNYASTDIGVLISINGVVQTPTVAYTVSGTSLTFSEVPAVTDQIDIRFLGTAIIHEFDNINPGTYLNRATATDAPTLIDTVPITGNTALQWIVSAVDNVNTNYTSLTISSINTGSQVYYNGYGILKSNAQANVATFTSNISSGNINLWATGDSSNVTVTFERLALGSATQVGYLTAGPAGQTSDALASGTKSFVLDSNGNVTLSSGGMINYANGQSILTNISTAGNINGNTNGYTIGYKDIPQISTSNANITITADDGGKHYLSTTNTANVIYIPTHANVPLSTGTSITVVLQGTGNVRVVGNTGVTLYMAGNATTGTNTRSISAYGVASILKTETNTWFISGTGVS